MLVKNDYFYTESLKSVLLLLGSCGGISLGLQKFLLKLNHKLFQGWLCVFCEAGRRCQQDEHRLFLVSVL